MGRLCHCGNWKSLFEAVLYVPMAVPDGVLAKTYQVQDARTGIYTLVLCI